MWYCDLQCLSLYPQLSLGICVPWATGWAYLILACWLKGDDSFLTLVIPFHHWLLRPVAKTVAPCCLSLGTSFKLLVLCSQLTPCKLPFPSSFYWHSNHWLGTWRPTSSLPSCSHPSTMACALETSIKYFPFSLFYDLKLLHYLSTRLPCVQAIVFLSSW